VTPLVVLARIFHELLSRDHEDGCATWQPQGVGSEAYLNGTSQGPTPEDARKDGHIRGCSKSFMKHPGSLLDYTGCWNFRRIENRKKSFMAEKERT
jgi:hypothetical protein